MATLKPIKGLSAIYEAVKKSWGSYLRFNETTKTIEFKEEELNTMTLRYDFWENTGHYVESASNLKKAILMVAQEQPYKTPLHLKSPYNISKN
jgi:hypothetical protein